MREISFIEDEQVIRKILKHLGLWQVKCKPQPTANAPPVDVFPECDHQLGSSADDCIIDPDYPVETYLWKTPNAAGWDFYVQNTRFFPCLV